MLDLVGPRRRRRLRNQLARLLTRLQRRDFLPRITYPTNDHLRIVQKKFTLPYFEP